MAFFELQDRSLFYTDTGTGNDSAQQQHGLPLVFVHGWCCNHTLFKPQADHFSSQRRVIAVDNAGHGQSPLPEDGNLSIVLFADDIAALLDHLNIEKAIIVGHSMGGLIALQAATAHADHFESAILVDPAPFIKAPDQEGFQSYVIAQLEQEDPQVFVRRFAEAGLFIEQDERTLKDDIINIMASTNPKTIVAAWKAINAFEGMATLEACQRPLCVISAELLLNDPSAMTELNKGLVHGQTIGAGHFNQLFAADQVNLMMERFLTMADRSS